ncbi:39S ribosomal protein L47, mitochondrial [Halotydeus destructor]|nr:39S ribosomal protein L47, mitochondrial [Halotydeus destructor]
MITICTRFVNHVARISPSVHHAVRLRPPLRNLADDAAITATGSEVEKKAEEPKPAPLPWKSNHPGLMEFFDDPEKWGEQEIKSGRSWKKEELRIKSNSDLHKLWFVLLKERNMLLTMKEDADDNFELFPSPERIEKVEESMCNLEDVVKERNKAYWELEVGEGETGERPSAFRRDTFGRHRYVGCSEHLVPYWMNSPWRKLYGPGYGKDVSDFIMRLRERDVADGKRKLFHEHYLVRQYLRRFPDMDLEYLQERYPRVPVNYVKDYLFKYRENRFFSRYSCEGVEQYKDEGAKHV